ncbi:MAG TPA: YihY/virulence factor BrkB family protein [Bacteroidota bacterium]|jgi:membrane protein
MVEFVIKTVRLTLHVGEAVWFYLRSLTKKLFEEDILFLASGLAFNSILTMIPLMLLSASVLGSFLNSSSIAMHQLNEAMNTIFPQQPFAGSIRESIMKVVEDIVQYRRSIGIFGVIVLVWTGTALFDALRSVLHSVYHLPKTRNLFVSLAHHVGFVFVVFILFVVSSVSLWIGSFIESIALEYPQFAFIDFPQANKFIPGIIFGVLTACMFYIVYRYIPDTKPPRAAGLISTLTTTILWIVASKLFSVYLGRFSALGKIYGSYAFILVILIWVYFCSLVFVLGAIVGQVYWERRKLREEGKLERWV